VSGCNALWAVPIQGEIRGGLYLVCPGEKTDARPWTVAARAFRFGQKSNETKEEGEALQASGILEKRPHIGGLPAVAQEEIGAFAGGKLEWRGLLELGGHSFLKHTEKTGRGNVENPRVKTDRNSEILGERSDLVRGKIDDQTLSDNERLLGFAAELRKKSAAGIEIGEVETEALQTAKRFLIAEDIFFVIENFREINLNPAKGRRQLQAVRARIEASGEINNHVYTLPDLVHNKLIDQISSGDHAPFVVATEGHGIGNLFAALTGEASGKGVAKHGVWALSLASTIHSDPTSGIGNVSNQRC
jgi:hypothetical protein